MNNNDPIFEALDRLASVVDNQPGGDPMPGIVRKARANRRRANALVVGGLAVVVGAGIGLSSVVDLADVSRDPGFSTTPSTPPTPDPSAPTTPSEPDPTTPPDQDATTPPDQDATTPPDSEPTTPPESDGPALAEYEQASADVDGDGAPDTIRVMIPEADAALGQDVIISSDDVRLQVELAAGGTVELRLGQALAPMISGTRDLDGNGTAEVALTFSGGDAGWLKVFTWDGDTLVQAQPAADSPADLVNDGGLYASPGIASFAMLDDGLISWVSADPSDPELVRVWTWQLDGQQLVAIEEEELQCMRPGEFPRPC